MNWHVHIQSLLWKKSTQQNFPKNWLWFSFLLLTNSFATATMSRLSSCSLYILNTITWLRRHCVIVLLRYDLMCLIVEKKRSLTALIAGIKVIRERTQQISLKKHLASEDKLWHLKKMYIVKNFMKRDKLFGGKVSSQGCQLYLQAVSIYLCVEWTHRLQYITVVQSSSCLQQQIYRLQYMAYPGWSNQSLMVAIASLCIKVCNMIHVLGSFIMKALTAITVTVSFWSFPFPGKNYITDTELLLQCRRIRRGFPRFLKTSLGGQYT